MLPAMDSVPDAIYDDLSQELAFAIDADGTVTWVDGRAERRGLAVGRRLSELVVAGCEDKLADLLRRAKSERLGSWELPLVLSGKPATLVVSTAPARGGAAVVASTIGQAYADAAGEAQRAVNEIVSLHRALARQNVELEESNRGIRALHAQLAQQADGLRASNEVKSRLVAGVSHEFRTPLHSILGLSRLLLSESDGPLAPEQRTQVEFIRSSAEELAVMINDMLDLARLDANTVPIRSEPFDLGDALGALRGTMRPLIGATRPVELVIEPAPEVRLETDQGKLGQILRNLVSNALKFTEHGSVTVRARVEDQQLVVDVIDTGIGIAPEDQDRVFEEFVQVESRLQREARGTGLGLPLARKLAASLGGTLTLKSKVGEGSTFTLAIPLEHPDLHQFRTLETLAQAPDPSKAPVLVVEDDRSQVFVYERYLSLAGFQVIPARTTEQARETLRRVRPSAILLDVMLDGEDTWHFLAELKQNPETHDIPVLVCTVMNRESRARALGADEFWLKPVNQDKLIKKLQVLSVPSGGKVLVIDDDEQARYLIKKFLADSPFELVEASDGKTGVQIAREQHPSVILLDFLLEEGTAFDVLDQLKADPQLRRIPVIIVTSHALPLEDRERLGRQTEAILSKEHLSRELAINRIRDALRSAGIRERSVEK